MNASNNKTAFILIHGSFHGAWCWSFVEEYLNQAGYLTVAIDLPAQGLNAVMPDAFNQRPLNIEKFSTEMSKLAAITAETYGDAVIQATKRARLMGAEKIIGVAHSAGGVSLNFAAGKSPDMFDALIYVAGIAPTPSMPSGAFLQLDKQLAEGKLLGALMADPASVGAFRMDCRSTDPEYMATVKDAMAADVPAEIWARALHLMTPDASAAIHGEIPTFNGGFEALDRTFICCTQDKTLIPSTCEVIAKEMTNAWPESPTKLVNLDASHEAMLSQPQKLAQLLIDTV